jgi:glutathione S-transferase
MEVKMTITLWGRLSSCNVQKVVWALGELGLAYEHIPLGGTFGGLDEPAYRALNPNGKVPTLRDGDLVLWESHAIVRYLAAEYGAGGLWPVETRRRAVVDQWTDWTATTFQPAWIDLFWLLVRTPAERHDAAAINKALAATLGAYRLLEQRLETTPFLAGERLSYADIVSGVSMYRWTTMPVQRPDFPNLSAWHRRLLERPAFRDAVCVSYADLVGRLAF